MTRLLILAFIFSFLIGCKGKRYRSPSAAMEKTIKTGETFFVTKTTHFKRNDLVVFDIFDENLSYDQEEGIFKSNPEWQRWLKRLIALSGDSIQLIKGEVYVNGQHIADPPLSLSEYEVFSKVAIDDFLAMEEYWPASGEKRGDTFYYSVLLTRKQVDEYSKRRPSVIAVTKKLSDVFEDTIIVRPFKDCKWTVDDFGPLKIPLPGEKIMIDSFNIKLYRNVPGIHFGENTIIEPLYFVMGDNRHQSKDSRYTGYISHSKMYGVVK